MCKTDDECIKAARVELGNIVLMSASDLEELIDEGLDGDEIMFDYCPYCGQYI